MMKKTLCLFFVLALVAQICARPEGKEKEAQEAVGKVSEEGIGKADEVSKEEMDKAREASKKGLAEAKHNAGKGKEITDDLQQRGKAAAGEFSKYAKVGRNAERNKHHGPQLSGMVREAEKTGEKFIESGTNLFANFMEQIGL